MTDFARVFDATLTDTQTDIERYQADIIAHPDRAGDRIMDIVSAQAESHATELTPLDHVALLTERNLLNVEINHYPGQTLAEALFDAVVSELEHTVQAALYGELSENTHEGMLEHEVNWDMIERVSPSDNDEDDEED